MKTSKLIIALIVILSAFFCSTASAQKNKAITLTSHHWIWVSTTLEGNASVIKPEKANAFSIYFNSNGSLYCTTDCNDFNGAYSVTGKQEGNLTCAGFVGTKMFCPDSQEFEFMNDMKRVTSYKIEGNIMTLGYSGGQIVFMSSKNQKGDVNNEN